MICAPFMIVASHAEVLLARHAIFPKEGTQDKALRMSVWGARAIMITSVNTCQGWTYRKWEIRGTLSYFLLHQTAFV